MSAATALVRCSCVLVAVVGTGCAVDGATELFWTIDGEDPVTVCARLPDGAVVDVTVTSRDSATGDDVDVVDVVTNTAADCGRGRTSITSGPFATVDVAVKDGDVVLAEAAPLAIAPGAPEANTQADAAPVVAALHTVRGGLRATLTVGGRSCADVGATSFSVSLLRYAEPRSLVPVVTDVDVPCSDDGATFVHAPVDVGTTYLVAASTTAGGRAFSTRSWGDGVVVDGPNTAFVVDLEAE